MDHMDDPAVERELASESQIRNWLKRFSCYRLPPTRETLLRWLERFDYEHLSIAHRILDQVVVVSELEIQQGYRRGLGSLDGWSKSAANRSNRWFFVGVGGAGESGPAMLRSFREANGLTSEVWNKFFVTQVELPRLRLSARDNLVFVDDFAGTGSQVVRYWPTLQELVASEVKCYLLLTAITEWAKQTLERETEIQVRADRILGMEWNVYTKECGIFSEEEWSVMDDYGTIAWANCPRGFGGCGLCFVLSHKTPNNSIPILHANHEGWIGVFPRNLISQ